MDVHLHMRSKDAWPPRPKRTIAFSQWESAVMAIYPSATITKKGKQQAYMLQATSGGWQNIVGEWYPDMTSGGGMWLPSDSGNGKGWILD